MANVSEQALHYPLGDRLPETGSTIEVAPGMRWLRMKLPFSKEEVNEAQKAVIRENTLESGLPESFNVLIKELQSLGLDVELMEKAPDPNAIEAPKKTGTA